MAEPILSVRGLETFFHADEGTVRAVDGASFDLHPGQTLGIVGESGCGKSVTARSILRIVERPGRVEGGEVLLRRADGSVVDVVKLPADGHEIREIRGGDVGYVFQEPMSSLSSYHTIGNQLVEAVRLHSSATKARRGPGRSSCCAWSGSPAPSSASTATRSSSPAACASA